MMLKRALAIMASRARSLAMTAPFVLPTLGALAPVTADAHAIIEAVTPAVNATVPGPDVAFVLKFNSRLDQQRSRLTLKGPDGASQPLAILVQTNTSKVSPETLEARATGLVPGKYVLHWQVLAVDGHMTRGNVPFTVSAR